MQPHPATIPRSPLLPRQPSAPSTLEHTMTTAPSLLPQSTSNTPRDAKFPRLSPVSENYGPPSITASIYHQPSSSSAQNLRLHNPLARLTSYSHDEPIYDSDDDIGSAAEADMEAVQAELDRSWDSTHLESGQPGHSGAVRLGRRRSEGTKFHGRGSTGTRPFEDDNYRPKQQTGQQQSFLGPAFYTQKPESNENHIDHDPSQSHTDRHHQDDKDDESSECIRGSEGSYTLKDRQDAINIIHPFGLKIWKPALYKKNRSVQRTAEGEIHSKPGQWPDRKIHLGNVMWTLLFGWWMCLIIYVVASFTLVTTWWSGGAPYVFVLFGLAKYLFYPFGRFIELTRDEMYAEEDDGEGQSILEYERYGAMDLERGRQLGILTNSPIGDYRKGLIGRRRGQSVESWGEHSERDSLLGHDQDRTVLNEEGARPARKHRFFGRGQWSLGRVVFFITFYLITGESF